MRKMLINARDPDLVRVAIIGANNTLEELDFEYAEQRAYKGNIYKAQVVRVEQSLAAAFVDFGGPRNGFLPLSEVSGKVLTAVRGSGRKGQAAPRDGVLERGQEVIVQATREPMGSKGAAMTTYVAMPGRYLVYLPDGETGGISRKISSPAERQKLSETVKAIRDNKEVGLIVRTAGLDRAKRDLQKDFRYLETLWKQILRDYRVRKGPGLIWREQGAAIRAARDYYTDDIQEIWVDNPETHSELLRFFRVAMPKSAASRVRLYEAGTPLFKKYGVEEQIAQVRSRTVGLPSGGSIVIDPTEALVAIDVNSGKLRGQKGIEETAFKTNCEAAREVARQLRLRNLGGIIVIDFIDMRERRKRTEVERVLKEAVKGDKANTTMGRIGRFGTLEMLRQRLRTSGPGTGLAPCPTCSGTGRTRSPQIAGLEALREIRAAASDAAPGDELVVPLNESSAVFLLNERRTELSALEQSRGVHILLKPSNVPLEAPLRIERRRGPSNGSLPQVPAPSRAAAPAAAAAAPAAGAGGAPASAGNPKRKKRRGSRGGRRKKKGPAASASTSAQRNASQAGAPPTGNTSGGKPASSAENTAPKRGRRRRGSRGGARRKRKMANRTPVPGQTGPSTES